MKIAAIETFVVSLPVRRPHTWAGNFSPPGRGYVVLKLTLEDGTVGWGEAQVLKDWGGEYGTRSGESHETTQRRDRRAAGADRHRRGRAADRERARQDGQARAGLSVRQGGDRRRHARCGRQALRRAGLSVARRTGAARDPARAQHRADGDRRPPSPRRRRWSTKGITTLKVKVGVDAARDIELVRRLRKTLGPDVQAARRRQPGLPHLEGGAARHPHHGGLRHLVHGAAVRGAREHGPRRAERPTCRSWRTRARGARATCCA